MSGQQETPPRSDWQVASLRLTGFPADPSVLVGKQWWSALTGEEPEQVTSLRSGELSEVGSFGEYKLIFTANTFALSWQLVHPDAAEDPLVTYGSLSNGLGSFLPLMTRWLQGQSPELQRLAFGAVFLQPVKNHIEGYRLLSPFLPFSLDGEGASDFFYQINRPRTSLTGIEGLMINRLSKWSVAKTLSSMLPPVLPFDMSGLESYAARLELDINTAPTFQGRLSGKQLTTVFSELVDLGVEISRTGDLP